MADVDAGALAPLPVVGNEPPRDLLYRHRVSLISGVRELWRHRETALALTERSLKSRYKQTFLGFSWALITPITLMVVFTLFFQRAAKIQTGGVPYPLYSYVGLLPWTLFSSGVNNSGTIIITNMPLLNKVYCPREVFPLSAVAVACADTLFALVALVALFITFTFAPQPETIWTPVLVLVLLTFVTGVSLVLAGITPYLRDLRFGLPIILQLGLFATPVAYGLNKIPESWLPAYSAINPLGPVIDGLRRTVLYGVAPRLDLLTIAAVSSLVWLVGGYWAFKRLEPRFADVA